MANSNHNPDYLISYGPDENCTLTPGPRYCPPSVGVYEYRPSLAANTAFIALFFLAMIVHIALGIRYKTWAFLFAIFWGCVSELLGYGGRVMLWENPFSFTGFLIQISMCLPRALVDVSSRVGSRLLTPASLYYPWSGLLLRSHLPNLVEDVSATHLQVKSVPQVKVDIAQNHFSRSATCTVLTKALLLDFHRMCFLRSFSLFELNLK